MYLFSFNFFSTGKSIVHDFCFFFYNNDNFFKLRLKSCVILIYEITCKSPIITIKRGQYQIYLCH